MQDEVQHNDRGSSTGCRTEAEFAIEDQEETKGNFMRRLKGRAKTVIGIIVFGSILLFFGLKSCIITTWSSPSRITTYAIIGEEGRAMMVCFMPQRMTLITYGDPSNGSMELILTKMYGEYGSHYFGRLWNVNAEGDPWGFRIYPSGTKPVVMRVEVVDKYRQGAGDSSFPRVGKTKHSVIVFGEGKIRLDGMWLDEVPTDPEVLHTMMSQLGHEIPE